MNQFNFIIIMQINLSKHINNQNKLMQQNVQSDKPLQYFNYSQQPNSIPSKLEQSENIKINAQSQSITNQNLNRIQIDGKYYLANQESIEKLKAIDREIEKQKELIMKLKIENQQEQHILQKSYFSLNDHNNDTSLFKNKKQEELLNQQILNRKKKEDLLFQTKTNFDHSILEHRKLNAIQELQTEQDKYRDNIRKIQLKRSEIKRKLKEDPQIPIRIMDFKELEIKKSRKLQDGLEFQPEQANSKKQSSQHLQGQASIKSSKNSKNFIQIQEQKQQVHISEVQESLKQKILPTQIINQYEQQFVNNSQHEHEEHNAQQFENDIIQKSIRNSELSGSQNNAQENKSRMSGKSNSKKYSVKMSSVIVPQMNESMKQILERKQQRASQKLSSVHHSQVSQKKQSSKKQPQLHESNANESSKKSSHQQGSVKNENLFVETVKQTQSQKGSEGDKQAMNKVDHLIDAESKSQNESIKQKSFVRSKHSSKKHEKFQLYVPLAPKQPSHKSFKKTDKSIQWSQVDISMYGRSNQTNNLENNNSSNLLHELNQQNTLNNSIINEKLDQVVIQSNKINMKKNKLNEKLFFEEQAKKSEKSNNLLEPIHQIKQKSLKQSKLSQHKSSFIASREGSVKQKYEKHQKFHREHSLNHNKKEEANDKDLLQIKNKISGNNKAVSYRSRKSNPISTSSKGKAKTVVNSQQKVEFPLKKAEQMLQKHKQQQISIKQSSVEKSRVLIEKKQIQFLHSKINQLQQKLSNIEKKQQSIIREKHNEITKLQELIQIQKQSPNEAVADNENAADNGSNKSVDKSEEDKVLQYSDGKKNKKETEIQQIGKDNQVKESKTGAEVQKIDDVIDQNLSQVTEKQCVEKDINNLTQIQAKFAQEKQSLVEEVSRLKKIIRDLQIQKIRSIQPPNDQTIVSSKHEDQKKRPETQNNEYGVIVKQNMMKNQTFDDGTPIQHRTIPHQSRQKSKSPFGKIVKNSQSPQKSSKILESSEDRNKSKDKNFRINIAKKTSTLSQNLFGKNNELVQLNSGKRSLVPHNDDEINDLLQRKRNQSYPIVAKEGYVVLNADKNINESKQLKPNTQKQVSKTISLQQNDKTPKSEIVKEQVLQKFHKTNRQFQNFIESSRVINETNSSMSSHNNLPFGLSGTELHKKNNSSQEYNPQNSNILKKLSSSTFQINNEKNNEFQQSFTRIINQIKNDQDQQQNYHIPEIQIRDLQIPILQKTPDITMDQDQLMELAKKTFKLFDIQIKNDDLDFNMKKYKNCVIFTKGADTILWHYNGKFYMGGWKNKQNGEGQKTGYGVQIVPQKFAYKGQFMNGKKHGTGLMKQENGTIYDGQWIEGIKNGQGIYYDSATKVVYSGQWKQGKKNGYGILKFSQKQYYEGTFIKSVKDGYGTEVFVNGDKYKGEYRKGKFHGKGKYSWVNGSSFQGDFHEGMRHGNGVWKSAKVNGDIYVGTYQSDKKSGYGRYVWSNGCIYEGYFAQDVKHGKGRLIYTDGKQIKGVWQQGSLTEAVSQNPRQSHQQDRLRKSTKFTLGSKKIK